MELYNGDCLEVLKSIPDDSVNLVLTDPPYNIAVKTTRGGKTETADWDKIDGYIDWCIEWLKECQRILKPNGVLYLWHNDMAQIAQLMEAIRKNTNLQFISFCIWNKGQTFRAKSWANRDPDGPTALRSWFNICEYCLHYFNAPKDNERQWKHTGLDRINSNPACYKPLKDWVVAEKKRLNLSDKTIADFYTKVTGRKPYMLRHYFQDSQFEIPTRKVWELVYMPIGFSKDYESLRQDYESLRQDYESLRQDYESLRQDYESLRQDYESLRNVHHCDALHSNVWNVPPIPSANRFHTCEKPVEILERLVRVSGNPGDVVLDCFMGSGSTGVACIHEGREFIGIEKDAEYFRIAKMRLEQEQEQEAGQQLSLL